MSLINFYKQAKAYVIDHGYIFEISAVKNRKFEDTTPDNFFRAFVYVVLNSGMKNQIAHKIYCNFIEKFGQVEDVSLNDIKSSLRVVGHLGKRSAINDAFQSYSHWFIKLKSKKTLDEKLEFLESLPWIGKITKYHLARNLGIDVAKPDRHLVRIAKIFHYGNDVQQMCKDVSDKTGDRIGLVDVILWRYANLVPSYLETADICENHCVGQGDYYCDEAICPYVPGEDHKRV